LFSLAAPAQIQHEKAENYAKMIGSDSVTNDFAFEELSYLGKTKNTLCFQHFAMLPHPPNACQMQSKTRGGKPSPLHNYHLSIFFFIESFR